MACFPGTQCKSFRGKHTFFATRLPAHSIMRITAKPKAGVDYRDGQPGKSESVRFMAIRSGYNILIGVAAPQEVTSGKFTLRIDVKPR